MIESESTNKNSIQQRVITIQELYELQLLKCQNQNQNNESKKNNFLTLGQFRTIIEIWNTNSDKRLLVKERKIIPMNLTYYNLKRLAYGYQLNDQVINSYLYLLSEKMDEKKIDFKILDSLLTISMLAFPKPYDQIKKTLLKKKITSKNFLILTILHQKHWFFVTLTNNQIVIYDSLVKTIQYYSSLSLLKALKDIAQQFYDQEFSIQIADKFPQQTNNSECGVMMLLGIKDVINMELAWTFDQKIAKCLRPLIAYELLTEKLKIKI